MDSFAAQKKGQSWSQVSPHTSMKQDNPGRSILSSSLAGEREENLRVIVRVRPLMQREALNGVFVSTADVTPDGKTVSLYEYFNLELVPPEKIEEYIEDPESYQTHTFTFDKVYDEHASQQEIYENTAQSAVVSALEGYNATLLAYGQTGTGKTYTMEGFKYNGEDPQRGIVPRAIEDIFTFIRSEAEPETTFMVRCSYLQIYQENLSDLLKTERQNLQIREKKQGVFVEGLSEWAVRSPGEIYALMRKGANSRATASTNMNDVSSRSHAVFTITIEQMKAGPQGSKATKVGKLNLVDLAGSERIRITGAKGVRLEECKKINQSLSALGHVIAALTDVSKKSRLHIPYRDSKLTRILEDSLGGNCKTTFMAMISPAVCAFGESLSTLKFANRAKAIKNAPIVNEDLGQKAVLLRYEEELQKLRTELEAKNKSLVDRGKLLQLEREKDEAERDKKAAIAALEARSREFFQEREQKRQLEAQISALKGQLLTGGLGGTDELHSTHSTRREDGKMVRRLYERRIEELEAEREKLQESRDQVDRYKSLLQKQSDIMIALTTRLNERDEAIMQLQEELDALDAIHRESENGKARLSRRIGRLEEFIADRGLSAPEPEENEAEDQEKVRVGECETFNVTYGNLNPTEEKLREVFNLAERRKNEVEELKEKVRGLETEIQNKTHSQHIESTRHSHEDISVIASSVNEIIMKLSQQNSPDVLKHVAKKLLDLQKLTTDIMSGRKGDSRISRDSDNRLDSVGGREKPIDSSERIVDRIFQKRGLQQST